MAETVRDLMTQNLTCMPSSATLVEAGAAMRDENIGAVLVAQDGGELAGLVTDRDIVVRAVAVGASPEETALGDVCSTEIAALEPDQPLEDAVRLMREKAVRRVPVVEDGRPVGILSIGDLAKDRDERSALADISKAPANT